MVSDLFSHPGQHSIAKLAAQDLRWLVALTRRSANGKPTNGVPRLPDLVREA
jgi:hypothetical protein